MRGGILMETIRLFFESLYELISAGIDFLLSVVIRIVGWPILHVMKGLSQTHGLERICYFLAFISLCALLLTAFYYFWVYFVPILIFFRASFICIDKRITYNSSRCYCVLVD